MSNGMIVSTIIPNEDVVSSVNVVVNADEVTVSLQQAENQVDALLGTEYDSDTAGNFPL